MKVTLSLIGAIIGLAMLAATAFAGDYNAMTTEELAKLRGKMQNVTVEERNAFQNEWQKRIQTMTQEDRQKYLGKPGIAGQGGTMQQKGSMGGRRGGRR